MKGQKTDKYVSKVDFAYTFGTPHRLTTCMPGASHKTICDVAMDKIRMAWSYDCLKSVPLACYASPIVKWELNLYPKADGQKATDGRWRRIENHLPALDCEYELPGATCRLEIAGAATAAITRITMTNTSAATRRISMVVEGPSTLMKGYNPAVVEEFENSDALLAGWNDRSDRILAFVAGADRNLMPNDAGIEMLWDVPAGETRTGFIIRPYANNVADMPALRAHDWARDFAEALAAWRELLSRASAIDIPDKGVHDGLLACLADLFVMREEAAEGYITGMSGTEIYRASNNSEPAIQAICLDQMGYSAEALEGYRISLDQQGKDGNWADPSGWAHHWWSSSGFKSWFVREHYYLTRDRTFLEEVFPRMLASTRFQEIRRATTRVSKAGERPLNYGLLPKGQGDCGLWDDRNYYGVYLPHNIWAVYGDGVTAEAADILERPERDEVRKMYAAALNDLRDTIQRGAIEENGHRWIPAVAGKTSGSRWGALNAAFPCRIFPADHELIDGTISKLESRLSPGGLPLHLGWMEEGLWVAITLDNLAETLLLRNDGDSVAKYLYASLNHATPLYSWCEERGKEAGSTQCAGDRQHIYTPIALIRTVRDCFVMEENKGLNLLRGIDRSWLTSGQPVGVKDLPTHFGPVTFELIFDRDKSKLIGTIEFPARNQPEWVRVHLRLDKSLHASSCTGAGKLQAGGTELLFTSPSGTAKFEMGLVITG